MKRFLAISFALFIFATIAVVGVYWYISVHLAGTKKIPAFSDIIPMKSASSSTEAQVPDTVDETPAAATPFILPEEGISLASLPLTDAQKNALESVGIDIETYVLTKAVLECGATKIGQERIVAIAGGGAPTFLEITKLVPCLATKENEP